MKLLRDESGYVLVLRRPQLVLVGKADEKVEEVPAATNAVAANPRVRCSVPHCCFLCGWCGEPILLPNDRIGSPFGNPDARKIDVESIATVCQKCKHMGNYTMFRGRRGFDTRHKIVHAPNEGTTALLNWLECEEPKCTARLPLFVKLERDPAEMIAETAGWFWDGLMCDKGHRIRKVALDPTMQLPLRTGFSYRQG